MKNTNLIIGIFISIICIIVFIILVHNENENEKKEFYEMIYEYPEISYDDSIKGIIREYKNKYDFPYIINVTFTNNKKYTLYSIKCYTDPNINLKMVIKRSTEVYKRKKSDTLEIKNGNEKHLFMLKYFERLKNEK